MSVQTLCLAPHSPPSDEHDDLFRSLFEWSGLCIACTDPDQRVVDANAELFRVFNRTPAQVRGCDLVQLLHPGFAAGMRRQLGNLADGRRKRFTEDVIVLQESGGAVSGALTGIAVGAEVRPSALLMLFVPYQDTEGRPAAGTDAMFTDISARILEGVAAGASTVQLAAQLFLSRQGVEYHVGAMLRRYAVPNRPALVSKAYELGILSLGVWPPRVASHLMK